MYLTIGTLIAITDEAEIVHHLKHIGAKIKFVTILEMESLINDGTGIIFFIMFS